MFSESILFVCGSSVTAAPDNGAFMGIGGAGLVGVHKQPLGIHDYKR